MVGVAKDDIKDKFGDKTGIYRIVFTLLCFICIAFLIIDLYLVQQAVELDKKIQFLIDALGALV